MDQTPTLEDNFLAACDLLRRTEAQIRERYGTESNVWYAFVVMDQHMRNLIDLIPGFAKRLMNEGRFYS